MLLQSLFVLSAIAASSSAAPITRREVPQEHSHEPILVSVRASIALDNPLKLQDPVFGLLGNAAAMAGIGSFTGGPDCMQTFGADLAFTNAKAKQDVDGMVNALIYRAIERNTGGVGKASVLCTAYTPVNPEIAALTQHQDPASPGAAATNKAITLELAKQIASVGGDPQLALKSGTFAPGDLNDSTGKGNTCDDLDDPNGCIFTKNLLVEDATAAEIDAAVAGAAAAPAANATAAVPDSSAAPAATSAAAVSGCPPAVTVTVTVSAEAAAATTAPAAVSSAAADAAATTAAPVTTAAPAVASSAAVASETAAAPAASSSAAATALVSDATSKVTTDANGGVLVESISTAVYGTCTNAGVTFGASLAGHSADQLTTTSTNQVDFTQGSAFNPQFVFGVICNKLSNHCGGTLENTDKCNAFAATIPGRDGSAAIAFNKGIEAFAFTL